MADDVSSQVVFDGAKIAIIRRTGYSDGTGESDVAVVDVSALTPAPASVRLMAIQASAHGMQCKLFWDATARVPLWAVPDGVAMDHDFRDFGGIANNAGAGITGDIVMDTEGAANGDFYSLMLYVEKEID